MDDLKLNANKKHVSYSQFKTYSQCPYEFYLDYVKGNKKYEDSLTTCFGTSIHESLQLYIKTLYTESPDKADSIDLIKFFKEKFQELIKSKNVANTEDELMEFLYDGEDILKEFLKTSNRIKFFPRNLYEFIDVELEIDMPVKNNVNFIAYIDLVLKNKRNGTIKLFDFKTSFNGWNDYMKEDLSKVSQLLLYKTLYSKKYNVPLHKIEVEFFILKRKLYENVSYPQCRIQNFIPDSSNKAIVSTANDFIDFLKNCFTDNGAYIDDGSKYPKNPSTNKKNCKYCSYKKSELCNRKQEL